LKALFLHPINADPSLYVQAIYQVIVLLVLNYSGTKILKLSGAPDQQMLVKNTIIFNAFVFCQVSIFLYFLQLKTFPAGIPFVPAFPELFSNLTSCIFFCATLEDQETSLFQVQIDLSD
jgi:hypothetical protein